MRQPVIRKVFETPEMVKVRSFKSGKLAGARWLGPYIQNAQRREVFVIFLCGLAAWRENLKISP